MKCFVSGCEDDAYWVAKYDTQCICWTPKPFCGSHGVQVASEWLPPDDTTGQCPDCMTDRVFRAMTRKQASAISAAMHDPSIPTRKLSPRP